MSFESMNYGPQGSRWVAKMIAKNAQTLHHLSLGFTTGMAQLFARGRSPPYNVLSRAFAAGVKGTLSDSDMEPLIHLSLESLSLVGLDLGCVIRGEMALDIDFRNVTELRLESCSGLSQAFSLFIGQGDSSKLALGALQDLFVRLEDPDPNFSTSLETFLTSVRGLTHLQVLIEKVPAVQNLEPILRIHGKTLRTLVWDERSGPRKKLGVCTSRFSANLGHLKVISRNCPSLILLGIPLDWNLIGSSDSKVHDKVTKQPLSRVCGRSNGFQIGKYFRKMPCLEVLNIRNLPQLSARLPMPHMDYFVKSLATMFVDTVNKERESTLLLKTVAVGAPLYRDLLIGTHALPDTVLSDYVRFRVYSVDYRYPSPTSFSNVLSEVAKGAAVSADEAFTHKKLLNDYWLG